MIRSLPYKQFSLSCICIWKIILNYSFILCWWAFQDSAGWAGRSLKIWKNCPREKRFLGKTKSDQFKKTLFHKIHSLSNLFRNKVIPLKTFAFTVATYSNINSSKGILGFQAKFSVVCGLSCGEGRSLQWQL